MTQEIYFDGNLMDIDESTKITLSIKNNLFTEIKKCVGNRTYTVQFPKTWHNLRVIKYAHLPQSDSDIPYNYHTAAYIRNGIEIFSDGIAYIISVKDKIEVCMVWGIPANIRPVFNNKLKLNEIPDDGKEVPYVRYNQVDLWSNLTSRRENYGGCYAAIDFLNHPNVSLTDLYGKEAAINRMPKMGYLRPSVFVSHILERLVTLYGISFNITDSAMLDWINKMLIPCVSDNANYTQLTPSTTFSVTDNDHFTCPSWNDFTFYNWSALDFLDGVAVMAKMKIKSDINYSLVYKKHTNENTLRNMLANNLIRLIVGGNGVATILALKAAIVGTGDNTEESIPTAINIYDHNGNLWNPSSGTNITDDWEIRITGYATGVECDKDGILSAVVMFGNDVISNFESGTIVFLPTITEATYGVPYELTINYPDCTVVEFLQWMAAITGTFPVQNKDEGRSLTIVFEPVQNIFNNKSRAIDWSSKLVRAYDDGAAREIGFTVDGWAQVNNYAYGNSDDVGTFADGKININNVQLDEEQDVVGDIFAALKPYNNVPLYKVPDSDNEEDVVWKIFPDEDQTDELLEAETTDFPVVIAKKLTVNNVDYIMGGFDETLYWSNILASERYRQFIASIQRTKILNEVFALTELDIKQFDETIPVYLAQYGHYYAVLEIKTSETGVSEVTLFQLEL